MPEPPLRDPDPGERADPSEGPAAAPIRGDRPELADWLDLLALLHADEGLPDAELRRRDRAIGSRIRADRGRPERWLVAWVRARRAQSAALAVGGGATGVQTAEAVRWAATALGLIGLAFGASAATGSLSFQPQGRINVVAVLGALVGLPGVLLALAILNALPARARRMIPFLGSEPEGGGLLQPARWALRMLPRRARDALEAAFARGRAHGRLAAPVQRWLLLSASQGAALAFQAGAVGAFLALVAFSDLSFGWSTTLRVEPQAAHRIATALSWPWAWAWPEAVPSVDLLERTRFFRIAPSPDTGVSPEIYGRWWPFVLATMACYGLLPRAVFFAVARLRLRRGLTRAMVDAPGARRLLGRMQAPLVETSADEEGAAGAAEDASREMPSDAARPWPGHAVVVCWAEAIPALDASEPEAGARVESAHGHQETAASGPDSPPMLAAGGRLSPSDDLRTAARAAALARASEDRPVAVVVRGFEPPTLDVLDFVAELRRQLGEGREIVIGLAHGDADDARIWGRKLATLGDPWLVCTTDVPLAGRTASETASPGPSEQGARS